MKGCLKDETALCFHQEATLKKIKHLFWMYTVAFMIAWHNVYFQKDLLSSEDRIEVTSEKDDLARDTPFPFLEDDPHQ